MSKYHLKADGNPAPCRAKPGNCPLAGEGEHYSSPEAAREAFEHAQQFTFAGANTLTLNTYDEAVEAYVSGSPQEVSAELGAWMDHSFRRLPEGARIVELGSGFGRDAQYLEDRGFDVVATDASKGFLKELEARGFKPRELNALADDFPPADGVFANAVLLHFTKEEAERVFEKVHKSISSGGAFAFSLKEGAGEEWSSEKLGKPRFFRYWREDELRESLAKAGFEDVEITVSQTGPVTWLHATAHKAPETDDGDYRMTHQPDEEGAVGYDIEEFFPGFYSRPKLYNYGEPGTGESIKAIQAIRNNPDAEVTLYRAVPKAEHGIQPGNWVSLSRTYAQQHAESNGESGWTVVELKARAKDIRTPGDSINEFGYFPADD